MVVVNKPAGLPTHPSGKYRLNSLTEVLVGQLGYTVHPTHRLDRMTSGIVVLGKTAQATSRFRTDLTNSNNVHKEYYAKVVGRFPLEDTTFDFPLFDIDANRDRASFMKAFANRKPAQTKFKLVRYDLKDDSSLVKCVPVTGRTHQIRKHLALMGHPIANDSLYKRPVFREISLLLEKKNIESEKEHESAVSEAFTRLQLAAKQSRLDKLETGNETCPECQVQLFKDSTPDEMFIYLHARQYTCQENGVTKWDYQAPLPPWAR
ncbi:bifunctional DRAP deaminase/tRNA pseudouridine synthase RIB2 [Sugiyamaella lignohabitans]|uniref:Bifunctional DRAP deaminase/tRNA pseudouridine synthase RIB2 n=1 Tax=Sugiyamaella lignohabitans TaxID=796027 RepID=A0A167CCR8_9ASCO|nr:bifunctional DRAP deaminase/tRNA pseudouridine synthase RIB2 [Sugiyamaella lignohabitans]ANB11516.1 bifunctional DRAP deaminase/tRNA pseudouridine synthase RIB2 [Sugiyamaella lignohabitans]